MLFLVADKSRYINGVTLPFDAGNCLKIDFFRASLAIEVA